MAEATPPPASPVAAPAPPVVAFAPSTTGPYADRERLITENLKQIYDPEIPMNIVDLGLIYGFEWAGDDLTLKMTLTAPGCPSRRDPR